MKLLNPTPPVGLDMDDKVQGVYILHFSRPIDRNVYRHYRRYGDRLHYVGQSKDIIKRLAAHRSGEGSLVTKAVVERGITLSLSSIFPIGLVKEEQVITRIGATKLCSICQIEKLGTEVQVDEKYQVFNSRYESKCSICDGKPIKVGQLAAMNKETRAVVHYWHVRSEV